MWRNVLLAKVSVAILSSFAIGGICLSRPWRTSEPWTESLGWLGTGAFFIVLAIGLTAAVFLMHRKP